MRGRIVRLSELFPILLVSLVVLSPPALRAQRVLRFFDDTLPSAPIPEHTTDLHHALERLRPGTVNYGQSVFRLRLFSPRSAYDYLPIENQGASELREATAIPGLLRRSEYSDRGVPRRWLAPGYAATQYPPIHRAADLWHYSQHIPWAGPIILRVRRQSEIHPRITDALKLFQPQF
jgi:hypothetical protein